MSSALNNLPTPEVYSTFCSVRICQQRIEDAHELLLKSLLNWIDLNEPNTK